MQTIYAFEIPVGVCWVFAAHHRDLCWRWESGILSNLLNADKKKKKKKKNGVRSSREQLVEQWGKTKQNKEGITFKNIQAIQLCFTKQVREIGANKILGGGVMQKMV